MSWQEYVDDHLLVELPSGGTLTAGAIIGQDGGVWAQNDEFPNIEQAEVDKIVAGFKDSTPLATKGIFVGGEKYMMIRGDEGAVIRGRGKENKSRGLTIKKTVSAMVVGIYDEGVQPGDCNTVVEKLGDYLIDQGI